MSNDEKKTFVPTKLSMLTILLSSMVILMGAAAIAPALEPISKAFPQYSAFVISLVVTLPALATAITGFGVGYLADRYGKVKVFVVSLLVFTLSGVIGFFTESFEIVLVGRFLLGIGIAGISLCTTALIGEYYLGVQRAHVVGYQSAAIGIGTLVLETAGGSLADLGWHEPFLIYLIGVPIFLFALISIREIPRAAAGAEGAMPTEDIPDRKRKIMTCYVAVFLEMFMMFELPTNFSYFISEIGESYLMCGILLGVLGVSQAAFSLLYSRSAYRIEEKRSYALSFLLMGAGMCIIGLQTLPAIFVSMVIVGFSLGLLMPTVIGSLSRLSTAQDSGKVMGGYSVALNLSTFVSAMVFTLVIIPAIGSYRMTYVAIGLFALVLFAVSYLSACRVKLALPSPSTQRGIERPLSAGTVQMYEKILIATDGSESSQYAVVTAINTAKKNNAEVTALYVFDPESYAMNAVGNEKSSTEMASIGTTLAKEALEQVVKLGEDNGVKVVTKTVTGHAAASIIDESRHYDLVICGSLGRTNIARVLMGSVAEKVARMSYCPVLVCRRYKKDAA